MILGSMVLAGGRSDRMGRSKPALPWGDGSLLLHTVQIVLFTRGSGEWKNRKQAQSTTSVSYAGSLFSGTRKSVDDTS